MRHEITQEEIKKAIGVIKDVGIAKGTSKTVPSEFVGYVAAFGAAITLTGVLPAVVLYGNEEARTQDDRSRVVDAIAQLLDLKKQKLSDYLLALSADELLVAEERIIQHAIVLKLALRTFRTEKDKTTPTSGTDAT